MELATVDWVYWFNRWRLLTLIGYMHPSECEQQYFRSQKAPAMLAGVK